MPMAQFFDMSRKPPVGELPDVSGSSARRERNMQRLQIGVTGVILMILLVGLASIVSNRAARTDATAVPEAAPTTEPMQGPTQSDPLVEAGVVPGVPAQSASGPTASPSSATQGEADALAPAD